MTWAICSGIWPGIPTSGRSGAATSSTTSQTACRFHSRKYSRSWPTTSSALFSGTGGGKSTPAARPGPRSGQNFLEQTCPLAETVIWTVVNNTITLFRFYKYLADSNCLQNSSIPCLKPAENVHATPAEAFPRIKHLRPPNNSAVNASIDVSTDNEPLIATFINTIDLFLEWIDIGSASRQEALWGFLSTEAAFNETEFRAQTNGNEFSIGRILREFFTCDLEETLECARVRSPLAASFAAMFTFLLLLTLFVPIPSVVTFFLWTLGLTYGVVYLSYGFSPLCWPRVPVCLGQGLYDVVLDIFPEQLVFSSQLKQERACANFHVDSSVQFIIAVETFYRGGRRVHDAAGPRNLQQADRAAAVHR